MYLQLLQLLQVSCGDRNGDGNNVTGDGMGMGMCLGGDGWGWIQNMWGWVGNGMRVKSHPVKLSTATTYIRIKDKNLKVYNDV